MLRAVASSAAQVREAALLPARPVLAALAERRPSAGGRRRAAWAARASPATCSPPSPAPAARCRSVVHRGYGLPGWVGAADLVVAVSCSGATEETLARADEAVRRGCRLLGVGAAGLAARRRCERPRRRSCRSPRRSAPRATLWALATPLLVAADALGLLDLRDADDGSRRPPTRLEQVAELCRPDVEPFVNPAKSLALELAGTLADGLGQPASSAGVAAYRFGVPARREREVPRGRLGRCPRPTTTRWSRSTVCWRAATADDDLFRDRVDDESPLRLRLVLIDDETGDTSRAEISDELAQARGVAGHAAADRRARRRSSAWRRWSG